MLKTGFYDATAEKLDGPDDVVEFRRQETLLRTGALQSAIFNSANFSSIATDAKGVIQIFNVGAERMLGYTAAEVLNKITPVDISDPQEVIARAKALTFPVRKAVEKTATVIKSIAQKKRIAVGCDAYLLKPLDTRKLSSQLTAAEGGGSVN